MFGNLLSETLTLRKKSTGHLHNFRANVQPKRSLIFTDNANLPVEEGDSIERPLRTSVETYTVIDRGYYEAVNSIPAHYQIRVRKSSGGASELEKEPITITASSAPAPEPKSHLLEKWHLVRMAAEVPTLKDLRALPVSKQAQLLLRRLATQYPSSDMSVGKMNLDMHVHASEFSKRIS
jgi:hypothetical protein